MRARHDRPRPATRGHTSGRALRMTQELAPAGTFATGGLGGGSGLGSQDAVITSDDGQWLYAVDAGSNDIATFRIRHDGLGLVGRTPSGGTRPISLTTNGDLVYVLNAVSN